MAMHIVNVRKATLSQKVLTLPVKWARMEKVQLLLKVVPSAGHVEPSGVVCGLERGKTINVPVPGDSIVVSRSELRWMASETSRILDGLSRDVRECKNVMLASLYARWVLFSGVLALVQRESGSRALAKQVDDLLFECGELFRGGKHDPRYAASDIAEINRKLDLLLVRARPAVQGAVDVDSQPGAVNDLRPHQLLPLG
jgi:hypothetical protein